MCMRMRTLKFYFPSLCKANSSHLGVDVFNDLSALIRINGLGPVGSLQMLESRQGPKDKGCFSSD
jgi:hypothetical protein